MQEFSSDLSIATSLSHALKQFSLESAHVEWMYQNLEARFNAIQENIKESHIRMNAKLAELNFTTLYLKTILDHINQGIIFINTQGIVTTYNVAAQQILGVEENQLLFHSFIQLFPDNFFGFSLQKAMETQSCPKINYVNWSQSNREILDLEIEAAFVMMDTPTQALNSRLGSHMPTHGLLVLIRNLTEMRRLQILVNRQNVLQELGEMAAHLAHEIRNPLGGIKGFASLLHQDLKEKPEQQKMAEYILEGTDNLNHLVTAILRYTKTFQVDLESTNLYKFFLELRHFLLQDSAWNPLIKWEIKTTNENIEVPIDRQLFKSALLNLIVNAAQSMPNGGTLTLISEQQEKGVIIQVIDTGGGIKEENLNKIFSPFFTTKQSGSGLGLAEVQKVIQAHHGWIEVESEWEKGTRFIIKIPIKTKE